jgi:hypothetical protein
VQHDAYLLLALLNLWGIHVLEVDAMLKVGLFLGFLLLLKAFFCWFLLVVFLLLQVVFLFVLVKVRVFGSPVSGQTPLRFPGII